jgi:predicted lipid-binding transport protein (Tim44 family)
MPYCQKCGNLVEENMAFCPRCGAPLKGETTAHTQAQTGPAPTYRRNEKDEKNEKDQRGEKNEKQEKGEQGFVGFLIGGLVLIILGIFSLLSVAGIISGGLNGALILVLIGVVIIIAAVYFASIAKKRTPQPIQ